LRGKSKYLVILISLVALTVIAACSEEQVPTQVPVEFSPTEAPVVERQGSEITPTPEVEEAPDAVAAGRELFSSNIISACTGCHSTGPDKVVGPGLEGVYDRAGSRTSLDADAYIEQSLREPLAFLVDGFPAVMPSFDKFSAAEMQNLIAYLKTLN
jgi:cytochrome c2